MYLTQKWIEFLHTMDRDLKIEMNLLGHVIVFCDLGCEYIDTLIPCTKQIKNLHVTTIF